MSQNQEKTGKDSSQVSGPGNEPDAPEVHPNPDYKHEHDQPAEGGEDAVGGSKGGKKR